MRFGAAGKGSAVTNRAYRGEGRRRGFQQGAGHRRAFQTRILRTPRTPLRLRKDMDMGDIPPFNQNSRAITVPALPLRYPQTGCRRFSQGSALAKRAYRGEECIARTKHACRGEEERARTKHACRGEEERARTKHAYRGEEERARTKHAYWGEEGGARTKHAYRGEEERARTKRAYRGEEESTRTKRAYWRDRRAALSKMRRSREAYDGVSPLHSVRLQTPLARLP